MITDGGKLKKKKKKKIHTISTLINRIIIITHERIIVRPLRRFTCRRRRVKLFFLFSSKSGSMCFFFFVARKSLNSWTQIIVIIRIQYECQRIRFFIFFWPQWGSYWSYCNNTCTVFFNSPSVNNFSTRNFVPIEYNTSDISSNWIVVSLVTGENWWKKKKKNGIMIQLRFSDIIEFFI